ncbi:MAG: protein kinase [Verrucomicrobia bacterium]|nr:protein kinase [Verrucomicrobiota bacterium]
MPVSTCSNCGAELPDGGACAACLLEAALFGAEAAPEPTPPVAVEAPFDPLQLPGRFGPYFVQREIAAGGMGVVYAARDERSGAEVALKLLRSVFLAGPEEQQRFRTEGLAVARLEHPHLVRIHDVGTYGGQPFLAMELLEGGSLADRLKRGPLPVLRETASIVAKIAGAVHHAHQRGVLHRDLKPSNVLFDAAGEPRLCDFGLAKLADDEESVTLTTAQMGTPPYMSPEQAAGRTREVSTASDVWALGVILYQMLAGRVPFAGPTHGETFRRILEEEPPALRGSSSGRSDGVRVDRDLESICLRCLEKEPARRLASAGEVAEELRRWLDGRPIRTRAITNRERAWRWARRHPFRVAGAATLLLTLAVGSVVSTIFWWRAEAARERAEANAYFAGLASALIARERHDFGLARRSLDALDPARRGFEWRLLHWLTRGDEDQRFAFPSEPRALAWSEARGRLAVLEASRQLSWLDPSTGTRELGPRLPDPRALHGSQPVDFGFHTLAASPDGEVVAAGDHDLLVVADARTGARLHSDVARRVQPVWLDNDRLLYGGTIGMAAQEREHTSLYHRRHGPRPLPRGILAPMAISADRTRLAWVRVLNEEQWALEVRSTDSLEDGPPLASFPIEEMIMHFAFSADARHLAVVSANGEAYARTLQVHTLPEGREIFRQIVPRFINAVAFHPREPLLAVVSEDTTVRSYRYLQPADDAPYDDACLPALAQRVPLGGPALPPASLLSRTAQFGRAQFYLGHEERIGAAAFMPDGTLLTGSADGTVRRWPWQPAGLRQREYPLYTVYAWEHPTCSADGRYVLALAEPDQAVWWDRETGLRRLLPLCESPVAVLRDGSPITRQPDTAILTVWEPGPDERFRPRWSVRTIPSHQAGFGMVSRAALSADENTLSVLIPGKVIVVNLLTRTASGTPNQRMLYGNAGVTGLDLSPDGQTTAVTGLFGRHVRLYRNADVNGGHAMLGEGPVFDTAAAFHPDGRRLFVGNEAGEVRVFDLATRHELRHESWRAQSGAVTAIAISRDGRTVATSGDTTLRLWDGGAVVPGETRRERLRLGVPAPRNWLRFTDGDRHLLHAAPDHAVEVWEAGG